MKRALCLIRHQLVYRREAFCSGLTAAGYRLTNTLPDPGPGDVLVIWNRYGSFHDFAIKFERRGADVVVAENGYIRHGEYFALAKSHHSGAGTWRAGGNERWDRLGIELQPWRDGGETVILGQRGIGEPGIASPKGWASLMQQQIGGRIRLHPGSGDCTPLEADLAKAGRVVTWHSAAALQALIMGIPVFCAFQKWIGMQAATPLAEYPKARKVDRLAMFRRLIWAQWRLDEIRSGEAFKWLLR